MKIRMIAICTLVLVSLSAAWTQWDEIGRVLQDRTLREQLFHRIFRSHDLMMSLAASVMNDQGARRMMEHHLALMKTGDADPININAKGAEHLMPEANPYAGQQSRSLKALSSEEIDDYLNARGMGLAKVAELNHYPGPLHVLQFAKELHLSADQINATEILYNKMKQHAVVKGTEIVRQEEILDSLFAGRFINSERLKHIIADMARLQGDLRTIHLQTHLEMKALLSVPQVQLYNQLRGYTGVHNNSGSDHKH